MHDHPLIHALGLVGVIGAGLPLVCARGRSRKLWIAHLAMVVVMVTMFLPEASGWVSVGMGSILIVLALMITTADADRSSTLACAADLTAMGIIMMFAVPSQTYSGGPHRTNEHYVSLHSHQLAGGTASITDWLGPFVLASWAAIALHPRLARRGPIGKTAKITMTSSILMLVGMAPMAA